MNMEQIIDKAVGVTFGNCQDVLKTLRKGDRLDLIPEPENQFDSKAVRIEQNGRKCGYVKRDGYLYALINENKVDPHVEVYQITGGCNGLNYGLTMKVLV